MATNQLTEYLRGQKCEGFTPHAFYSRAGDFVTYFFQDEECYAERVDEILTVYLSALDSQLVGVKLKGIKHLQAKLGDYGFHVFDGAGKPMLGMLFIAGGFAYAAADVIDQYRRLAEETKSVPLEERDFQLA